MTGAAEQSVCLTNGIVDLEISVRFGPRILRYGFVNAANMFGTAPGGPIDTAIGPWLPHGGHRLWVAPESMPGSYAPDAGQVEYEQQDERHARFARQADAAGIEKLIAVHIAESGTHVRVTHVITNRTYWPVRVAPWAITAVRPDSTAIIPQPPFRSHSVDLLPARPLVQWSFTDFSDSRWSIGKRLVRLRPDAALAEPQKAGAGNQEGWCAVIADDEQVFIKRFGWDGAAQYPDYGCNNEVFTAGMYLEVETLGPVQLLPPGQSAEHEEHWHLFPDAGVPAAGASEERQHAAIAALVDNLGL
jgi:hypothetical protein